MTQPKRSARPRRLKPRHAKILAERAISPEVAEARGYWSLESTEEFRQLGWGSTGKTKPPGWLRPPGLAIPIFSVLDRELGEENPAYSQYRPDRPVKDKEGKVRKYLNPTGSMAVVDVNPGGYGSDLWVDRDTPLFIVEGVPKGDACWSAGLPAVSIQGVWNFTTSDEDHFRGLLADLRYLPVAGREVVIAFDADAWTNNDVSAAARELGRVLSTGQHGASKVSALMLPDPEKKTGIDDFLARGGGKESVLDLLVDLDDLARGKEIRLSDASTFEKRPPKFLWEPYLLSDTLCFLDGAPGVGKTWIALALTAAVTRGGKLPSADKRKPDIMQAHRVEPGNVLYLTQENSAEMSMVPRLERLGADLTKVFLFDGHSFEFTVNDPWQLKDMIKRTNPSLVVLDPIMNFIGEGTDAHRDNEIRPMLSRLMTLAEETNTTILGVRHLRKAATGSAVYAAGGSVAFSGAARSIILAAKHMKEGVGETTVMAHAKANEGPMGATLEYAIDSEGKDAAGFFLTNFEWRGASEVEADSLVSGGESGGKRSDKLDRAKAMLHQMLSESDEGGLPASVIETAAESIEVSRATLKRAAKELDVVRKREGGVGEKGQWVWRLPQTPGKRRSAPKPSSGSKF